MSDLRDLYQDVILEHSKTPRNYRELPAADHKAEGFNPLCGDRFTVYVTLDGDTIRDVSFQGSGCAISKSSASMMTQSVKGKTLAEAEMVAGDYYYRAISLEKLRQPKPAMEAYRQFLAADGGKMPDQEFQARQRIRIIENELNRR